VRQAHPTKPPFARNNSSQRVHSREQIAKRLAPLHQHHQQQQPAPKAVNGNTKGFSITNASQEDEDDEDEWVSSESGAATPNHKGSDSDTASEADVPNPALLNFNLNNLTRRAPSPPQELPRTDSTLPRVQTVRPSDFEVMTRSERNSSRPVTPVKQQHIQQHLDQNHYHHHQQQRLQHPDQQPRQASHPSMPPQSQQPRDDGSERQEQSSESSQSRHSPRPKHLSRPPSTHSNQSRAELRPHPLIRGQSYGAVPKPVPLAPLTVVPTAALPQISTSPPSSTHDGGRNFLSSSPTSLKTSSGSPASSHHSQLPFPSDRRSSFSSARSVNTIPVHSTIIRESPWTHDRTRTFSTMSASSSSAALSSLSHIPNVTRPSSPQSIAFFPPINPHANPELVHPLLPTPYLQNHLTILSRRAPIKESFERVIRAKNAR